MKEWHELKRLDHILSAVSDDVAERVRLRQRSRLLRRAGFLFAAAATVVGAVLVSADRETSQLIAPGPGLDVASSRSFVVLPTSRADITVVWLLD